MADDATRLPPRLEAPAPLRLTDAEFDMLVEMGAAARLGRVELRGGEIWRMSPTYIGHGDMTAAVFDALRAALAGGPLRAASEVTAAFEGYRPTPDVTVFRRSAARKFVPAADVRLVVEVADTTLADDLGDKRARYAAAGVPEYWVIDMGGRQVLRFDQPGPEGFRAGAPVPAGATCESLTISRLAVETAGWPWVEDEAAEIG
jgi:Uma2 family endonuclease